MRASKGPTRRSRVRTPPVLVARAVRRFIYLLLQRSLATFGSAKEDRRWPIVFACCTAYGFSFSAILTITNWLEEPSVARTSMNTLANYYAPGTSNLHTSLLAWSKRHNIVTFGFENLLTIGLFSAFCAVASLRVQPRCCSTTRKMEASGRWWMALWLMRVNS